MDEVLKLSCGFSSLRYASYGKNSFFNEEILNLDSIKNQDTIEEIHWDTYINNASSDINMQNIDDEGLDKLAFIPTLGKVLCCIITLFVANTVFMLSWHRLVKVYTFLFSLAVIIFSYQANMATVKFVTSMENTSRPALLQSFLALNSSALWDSGGNFFSIASNYVVQAGLGLTFTALIPVLQQSVPTIIIIFSFVTPTFALLLPLPQDFKLSVPVFTALLPLGILKFVFVSNLFNFVMVVVRSYQYALRTLNNYGLHALIENEWVRLNVPNVLRTFWMVRTAQHLAMLLGEYMYIHGEYQSIMNLDLEDAFMLFKEIMIYGCETSIALLGMTSVVSYIGHYIGVVFQAILMSDDDEERSMGTVCAILFFVLAEQSGITVLEGEKRFVRLCRNFSFLFTAMLHFTHNMVNPVLMSLSASRNPVAHRHARALFVSAILIGCPYLLISTLWNQYPLSTWLLAVSAFSVQVVVKTLVSLLIYILFLIDAYRNNFWESLDDYVYYIKAFGNSVEFIFGILLFFTGAWIYFFESGGSIRATMMCIHAYFNIWCEAKNGWSIFMKRRSAVNKINSLPDATQEELDERSDVCAICFQELRIAKVTKCNHFFHSICLRKWLYLQDSCPLCHKTLYKSDEAAPSSADENIPTEPIIAEPLDNPLVEDQAQPGVSSDDILWDYEDINEQGLNNDSEEQEHASSLATESLDTQQPATVRLRLTNKDS